MWHVAKEGWRKAWAFERGNSGLRCVCLLHCTLCLLWRWGEPCSSTATQRAVMIRLSLQGIVGDRLAADRLLPWDKSTPPPPSPPSPRLPFTWPGYHANQHRTVSPLLSSPCLPPLSLALSPSSVLLEIGPFVVARNRTQTCHWFPREHDDDYTITPRMSQCRNKRQHKKRKCF